MNGAFTSQAVQKSAQARRFRLRRDLKVLRAFGLAMLVALLSTPALNTTGGTHLSAAMPLRANNL